MGLLNLFSKSPAPNLAPLPVGSFTVDRTGRILASTLPHAFPPARVKEIGQLVISTFQAAQEAKLPMSEIIVDYASLKLTAREMRGGAIIFFAARTALDQK